MSPKHKHATGTSDTYGVKALKPRSVHHRHILSVTLSFVTRNPLVPEIVCEHGGPGITPSSLPLSVVRNVVKAKEWSWWRGGCGLRMDNKYAAYDQAL